MSNFFRIHSAAEPVESLLADGRKSRAWVGDFERRCEACAGQGYNYEGDDQVNCAACRGQGRVEDVRAGVSCCADLETLVAYWLDRAGTTSACVLVELEGEESEDEDHDAAAGAVLVHPTRIVRVVPLEDSEIWDLLS